MRTPKPAAIVEPAPTQPWRPRDHEDGVVWVSWSGEPADRVRVRTSEFSWEGEDTGEIGIPATTFEDEEDRVEIRRRNQTPLVGGAHDSWMRATVETRTDISVIDPYD